MRLRFRVFQYFGGMEEAGCEDRLMTCRIKHSPKGLVHGGKGRGEKVGTWGNQGGSSGPGALTARQTTAHQTARQTTRQTAR